MVIKKFGFFACDYCGLQLDTLEEAIEHEQTQCPRAAAVMRRPMGQQQQPGIAQQSPNYFFHQQHHHGVAGMGPLATEAIDNYPPPHARVAPYAGYARGIPPSTGNVEVEPPYSVKSVARGATASSVQSRCFPLAGFPPDRAADILTMIDTTACQNIEVFEATPEIIADYERMSGECDRRVVPKQVGLRCRNCGYGSSNNSTDPRNIVADSLVFPEDLSSVGSGVRQIADRHLISCNMTNPDVQSACQRAASKRHQTDRGMVDISADNTSHDVSDDQVSKTALADYCLGICQQMGIVDKQSNKSGIEFSPSAGTLANQYRSRGSHEEATVAPTPLERRRETSTTLSTSAIDGPYSTPFVTTQNRTLSVGGAYGSTSAQPGTGLRSMGGGSSYPVSHPGQQPYADPPPGFPFYQESDRTWHCKYCSHIPHQFRDSQSIWSSSGGGPPPSNFIDQHLSICRAYRQQNVSSMASGGSMFPTGQTPFGMVPYGNPSPSPYGLQLHGQPPNPSGSWETAASLGGTLQPGHVQYSSLSAHQDPNYRYGQLPPLPPGIVNPHAMDTNMGGARFLSSLGQIDNRSGYPDRGSSGMPVMASASARNSSYSLGGNSTADLMKDAMTFLANYDTEYYARDPVAAKIPKLVLDEDHLLLTDYFFYLMKQLRMVRFTENDRKTRGGKREKIKIGYGGLQCIHCADLPMSRKFFWSNVDRLANSFAEIPGHVLKCRRCPQANKDALMRLKQGHPEQMSKLPRGSQKIFFRRMWRRLHEGDPQDDDVVPESPRATGASENPRPPVSSIKTSPEKDSKSLDEFSHSGSITVTSDETILVMQRSAKEAAKALAQSTMTKSGPPSPSSRILVAIPEDKEWLSDIDSYVRKQLEVFCATEEDVAAAREDRKYPITLGQVGIRCIHCSIAQGNNAIGHAIAYPFNISGIYESVKEFHRLHLDSCPNLPATSKAKLDSMKGASSLSSVLRKYYTLAAKALGLVDTKDGIRTGGESTPIGSLAAFTFSETEGSPSNSKEGSEDERKSSGSATPAKKVDTKKDEGSEETEASRIGGKKRSGSPSVVAGLESKQKYLKREP